MKQQTLYTKSTCPICQGTGEIGSYVGQCYRCKGEKTRFYKNYMKQQMLIRCPNCHMNCTEVRQTGRINMGEKEKYECEHCEEKPLTKVSDIEGTGSHFIEIPKDSNTAIIDKKI